MLRAGFLVFISLLLSACQTFNSASGKVVKPERIQWEQTNHQCRGEQCSLVNMDTLVFPKQPHLNQLITRNLLKMANDEGANLANRTLEQYSQRFLATAEPGWQAWLQARVLDQHNSIASIEFSSYIYTGGAHGMPGRATLIYDWNKQQVITLQDMLRPGQEAAFWELAERAHLRWLDSKNLQQEDPNFLQQWPFQKTDNIALTKYKVQLIYPVYALAPYSSGHPVLDIPKTALLKIFKPEYLR
ncbi:hypothetical protein AKN87_06875 [Thiopseudomonas alkaliphila]|uniref:DUF3298 and DUF4163 domain-containing protein n=1 Tax=Thiopseudomonas alkaliphila TaxID=1697053 RepID=UPI00069CF38D|nr:DUF3298 and DUF4163 domain-containing protein [Thiopseudomonas alkaliphila]AKX44853.1 hypothetical protein AKN87_06875 [Thiopseudomonas alkaliphila]AKX47562.1 hypothetical protein AKN94_09495 [Thiopseudomonas alkaliphila]AKX48222.1 hypothetical protein AKN93_01465 [Thiopseudomonas alkaliphila]AKX53360.1 hypothetical protein AKN91_06525 [Thiopseudomonas alkaliphila]AKX55666.1 hypothetical protein AKN90_08070 [Thiopseudomonas alkaliphila]